jgi:hypothetical protein
VTIARLNISDSINKSAHTRLLHCHNRLLFASHCNAAISPRVGRVCSSCVVQYRPTKAEMVTHDRGPRPRRATSRCGRTAACNYADFRVIGRGAKVSFEPAVPRRSWDSTSEWTIRIPATLRCGPTQKFISTIRLWHSDWITSIQLAHLHFYPGSLVDLTSE